MLRLRVHVPALHDQSAVVELISAHSRRDDLAAATVAPDVAARMGNPSRDPMRPGGHPATGTYSLVGHGPTPADCVAEYGPHLFAFAAESGEALEAEAFGRIGLLCYSGPPGSDGFLRPTQGGLRLSEATLKSVLRRAAAGDDVLLEIRPLTPKRWWQFWRRVPATQPLSSRGPFTQVSDEAALLAPLLGKRRRRPPRREEEHDRRRDRDDDRSSSSERSEPFRGGGGSSGGAGASGGWDAPSAAGTRGPGVDASGRILAAGVAAAAVAGAAAASRAEDARATAGESGGTRENGGTGESGGSGSDSPASGDTSGTTSTTGY